MNAMKTAIQEALTGVKLNHGGPFGAVIVHENKIIASAHNTVLKDQDPTCHAEMNAIRKASNKLGTHILDNCSIYTTAEPCPMCYGAIYWSRINKIYIGVDKSIAAKFGFDDAEFYKQLSLPENSRKIPQEAGVLASMCEDVFVKWKELNRELY